MKTFWVIKVTFRGGRNVQVNFNEGYTTYEKAKAAVLKKIDRECIEYLSDYNFFDIENCIEYELKLVDVID